MNPMDLKRGIDIAVKTVVEIRAMQNLLMISKRLNKSVQSLQTLMKLLVN
jgi:hypothetical protein